MVRSRKPFRTKGSKQGYYFRTTGTEAESKYAFGKPNKKESQ